MGNNPSREQLNRLFDLADRIKALKPWTVLGETDVFGVRDPETGVDNFVSVMGGGGEHFAVAVYLGAEALFQFWMLQDPDMNVPPEMVLAIRQLQLSFENRDDLEKEDLEWIKSLGRKYRGKHEWPVFRSFLPGYLPWKIDAKEANILIHALEQAIDVVTRAAKDAELLEPPDDATYLIRVPEVSGDAITWRDQLVAVDAPKQQKLEIPMADGILERVAMLPKRKKSTIEMDFLPLPTPLTDDSGRPFLPTMLLVVDGASGMILMSEVLPPVVGIVETMLQVPEALAKGLVTLGYVPGTVRVRHAMAAEMAQILQEAAGWKIKTQDELKMLDPAVDFLMSTMLGDAHHAPDDEELEDEELFNMIKGMLGDEVEDEPVRHRGPSALPPAKPSKSAKPGKSNAPSKSGSSKATQVYQLKITLKDTKPPIWRRVLVPDNLTLNQLHHVIQVSMGWYDAHLHEFVINGVSYGSPNFDFGSEMKDDNKVRLNRVLGANTKRFRYTYDFGDNWEHIIEIEQVLPYESGRVYPVCIGGKRACPPEDVGGVWGYEAFLEAINDPSNPEHDGALEWVGGDFDPEEFDIEEVNEVFARMNKR